MLNKSASAPVNDKVPPLFLFEKSRVAASIDFSMKMFSDSSAVSEAEALSVSERKSCIFSLKLVLSLASKITEN